MLKPLVYLIKYLRNSIYRLVVALTLIIPACLFGKDITIKAGIYDFTDNVSKEFYKLAPAFYLDYDIHQVKKLALNISAGYSFTSVEYNAKRHKLSMVPIYLTIQYHLADSGTIFQPYIAGGATLHMKWDKNPWFMNPHFGMTYGYIMQAGLDIPIKQKVFFTADIKYNILIPPAMEELNLSGIISAVGIKIPIRSSRRR